MRNTINYKQSFIILFILLVTIKCNAQNDSNWVLKFTKKGIPFVPRLTDYQPNKQGFYLYENGVYILKLKDGSVHNAQIKKIIKDSIVFTDFYNYKILSTEYEEKPDTISPTEIKLIRVNDNVIIDNFTSKRLKKYDFNFYYTSEKKNFLIDTIKEFRKRYEMIKKVTAYGIENSYVELAYPIKYEPYVPEIIDSSKFKTRNFIWLSPLRAKEINGLAVGIATGNSMFSEMPVKINGVNLNVDLITGVASIMISFYNFTKINAEHYNDSSLLEGKTSINGISLSAGGIIQGKKFNGLFINGGMCEGDYANGIYISGVRNMFYDFKGISFSIIRNDSYVCKGLQIGLINTCKHLKGIQIGLWNVNSKRKLPFINWGT